MYVVGIRGSHHVFVGHPSPEGQGNKIPPTVSTKDIFFN
jgi:hypothetical protein